MLNFALGVIVGLLVALIAVIVGKKGEKIINDPHHTLPHVANSMRNPKAYVVKKQDDVDQFIQELTKN